MNTEFDGLYLSIGADEVCSEDKGGIALKLLVENTVKQKEQHGEPKESVEQLGQKAQLIYEVYVSRDLVTLDDKPCFHFSYSQHNTHASGPCLSQLCRPDQGRLHSELPPHVNEPSVQQT